MRFLRRTAKGEKKLPPLSAHGSALGANGGDGSWEKNSLPCAIKKRTANSRVCRAPRKKRTAKNFLPCIFSLPCVPYQTHGKVSLYRAPDEKCTAKIFTHDKSEFFRSGH
jgi:hypothetical protein